MLGIVKNDPWLQPYSQTIEERYNRLSDKEKELTQGGKLSLSDFASGYLYFGLHKTETHWVIRELAPNATEIYLIGTFNNWQRLEGFKFHRIEGGEWELQVPLNKIRHSDLYKLHISWDGGWGERIPAWSKRVFQDKETFIFSSQVWDPEQPYRFKKTDFKPDTSPLLIYESHVGMATEDERVGTYREFKDNILPKIKEKGYNAIQLMAIQEHPYYSSFGYQ